MGKTSETKNKILKLLESGDKRLIDVYPKVGLSAATVSQHLQELKEMGLIEQVDNQHFKNMKYYRLVKKDSPANEKEINKFQVLKISISVIAIAAIIGALILLQSNSSQYIKSGTQQSTLNVFLTDPPHVPLGTQSLNISYSSIQVHLSNAPSGNWIMINSSGTIDLMSLINVSTLIGSAEVPVNATIDTAAFDIVNASITLDNVSYPVLLSTDRVIANVFNSTKVSNSSNLLFDFSPSIITIYTDNSTIFEMVPSVKAVIMPNGELKPPHGSSTWRPFALNAAVRDGLNATGGSITILGSNITTMGNNTYISITVQDTSNSSITLDHLLVFGNESLYINANAVKQNYIGMGGSFPPPIPYGVGNQTSYNQSRVHQGGRQGRNGTPYNGPYNGGSTGGLGGHFNASQRPGGYPSIHPNGSYLFNATRFNATHKPPFGIKNGTGSFNSSKVGLVNAAPGSLPFNPDLLPFGMPHGFNIANAYNWTNGQLNISSNSSEYPPIPQGPQVWAQVGNFLNIPVRLGTNMTAYPRFVIGIKSALGVGLAKEDLGVINFIVNSNGTLSFAQYASNRTNPQAADQDYELKPGETTTIIFNGTASLGSNLVIVRFISGAEYKMVLVGDQGVYASYNVFGT